MTAGGPAQKNAISVLGEHCQKHNLKLEYEWFEDQASTAGRWGCTVRVRAQNGAVVAECSRQDGKKNDAKRLASQDCVQQMCPSSAVSPSAGVSTLPCSNPAAAARAKIISSPNSGSVENLLENSGSENKQSGESKRLIKIHCSPEEKLPQLRKLVQCHAQGKNFSAVIFAPRKDGDCITRMLREDPTLKELAVQVHMVDVDSSDRTEVHNTIEDFWRGSTTILVACPALSGSKIPPDCRLIVQYSPREAHGGVRAGRIFRVSPVEVKSFVGGAFNAAHALHAVFIAERSGAGPQDMAHECDNGDEEGDEQAPLHAENKTEDQKECRGDQKQFALREVESAPEAASTPKQPPVFKRAYAVASALHICDPAATSKEQIMPTDLHINVVQLEPVDCNCPGRAENCGGQGSGVLCVVTGEPLADVTPFTLHPPFPDSCQHARRVRFCYRGVERCDSEQIEDGLRYYQHAVSALAELGAQKDETRTDSASPIQQWDGMAFGLPYKDGVGVDWELVREVNTWFDDVATQRKRARREASDVVRESSSQCGTLLHARYLSTSGKLSGWRPYLLARTLELKVGESRPKSRFATRDEWDTFFHEMRAEAELAGREVPAEDHLPIHDRYWPSNIELLMAPPLGFEEAEAWRDLEMLEAWPLWQASFKHHQPPSKAVAAVADSLHKLIPAAALCQIVPLHPAALSLPCIIATLHRLLLPAQLSRAIFGTPAAPPRWLLHACTTPQGKPGPCSPYLLPAVEAKWTRSTAPPHMGQELWGEKDYQQLEFVGDAFVHIAVAVAVALRRPSQGQQQLVQRLCHRVSNLELQRVSIASPLPTFMLCEAKFISGREPGRAVDAGQEREVHRSTCADVLEAVIGASWLGDHPGSFLQSQAWQACVSLGVLNGADQEAIRDGFAKIAEMAAVLERSMDDAGWMRLPTEDEQRELLGLSFEQRGLLAAAVLHPSEEQGQRGELASLSLVVGDAALKAVFARWLIELKPDATARQLTRDRTGLWSAEATCRVGVRHGLHRWVQAAPGPRASLWAQELAAYEQAVQSSQGGDLGSGTVQDARRDGVEEPRALNRLVRKLIGAVLLDSVVAHGFERVLAVCQRLFGSLVECRVSPQSGGAVGVGGWANAMQLLEERKGKADVQLEWVACCEGGHTVQAWVGGVKAGVPGRGDSVLSAKLMAAASALESMGW